MDVTNTRLTDADRRVINKACDLADAIGLTAAAAAVGFGQTADAALIYASAFGAAQTAIRQLDGIIARLDGDDA